MSTEVVDRPERHRYELAVDGARVGLVTYREVPGGLDLLHTEIDPEYQGRGLAAVLVRAVLDDVRGRGLQVVPSCPYVRSFIDGHRDGYLDLVPPAQRHRFGLDD